MVRFNTKDLKNGAYFYVLKTENQEVRKRLIIQN
ncbi:MAG: T9SS type A sorting domain-containing protein [Flavobacteriales bacterium]